MKKILVTGAGSGIGRAVAIRLAERGHDVIASTRTIEQADALKREQHRMEVMVLDITKEEDREKIKGLDIDVLINNAGIGESGSLAEVPVERIRKVFETNVFSAIALTQLALKGMIERQKGTVIFVSSLAGRIPIPYLAPYSMTKYALSGGIAALRKEVASLHKNIYISLIEPGPYMTGFNERISRTKYEWMGEHGEYSYFKDMINTIKKNDERFFKMQDKNLESIVSKIVNAAEADRPRLRYVAPWYFAVGVWFARALGK